MESGLDALSTNKLGEDNERLQWAQVETACYNTVEKQKITEEITTVESVRCHKCHSPENTKINVDEEEINYDPYDPNLVDVEEIQMCSYEGLEGSDESIFRNPDLDEVIQYLASPDDQIRQNAAAFLQHLCYRDDRVKLRAMKHGAIPLLIAMLINQDNPVVQRNALGALRNLCFGHNTDSCKIKVNNNGGIEAIINLIRVSPFDDIRDVGTATLWNMSSSESLKSGILDQCLYTLVNSIIVPYSGWSPEPSERRNPQGVFPSFFRNATGILRNCSSSGFKARERLRSVESLVPSLLHAVQSYITSPMDNKSLENCLCLLRNLCYRVHDEVKAGTIDDRMSNNGIVTQREQSIVPSDHSNQVRLLWQPCLIPCYVMFLRKSNNPWVIEASAGCLQNLTAWSGNLRAEVRRANGLPILIELLRQIDHEPIVRVCANALRNLAEDSINKAYIGQHGISQLVRVLPPYISETETVARTLSTPTLTATLAALNTIIYENEAAAKNVVKCGGVERMIGIVINYRYYELKLTQYASYILKLMWKYTNLHGFYKSLGFVEADFKPDDRLSSDLRKLSLMSNYFDANGGRVSSCTLLRPKGDLAFGLNEYNTSGTLRSDQLINRSGMRYLTTSSMSTGSHQSLDGHSVLYATVKKPAGTVKQVNGRNEKRRLGFPDQSWGSTISTSNTQNNNPLSCEYTPMPNAQLRHHPCESSSHMNLTEADSWV